MAVVARLLAEGGAAELPRGMRVRVGPRRVVLLREREPGEPGPTPRLDVDLRPAAAFHLQDFVATRRPFEAALDADRLGQRHRIRPLDAAADRFTPLGSSPAGEVGVADWLARRGVPGVLRERMWVVEGRAGIAWVVGHRIDAAHAVAPTSRAVAILRVFAG
jgi:hypothetical protein